MALYFPCLHFCLDQSSFFILYLLGADADFFVSFVNSIFIHKRKKILCGILGIDDSGPFKFCGHNHASAWFSRLSAALELFFGEGIFGRFYRRMGTTPTGKHFWILSLSWFFRICNLFVCVCCFEREKDSLKNYFNSPVYYGYCGFSGNKKRDIGCWRITTYHRI